MHKIYILRKKMHEKNYAQKMLVNFFLESINENSFFHGHLPVFPLILTETLAKCSLIKTVFFFGLKFINSKFSKTCHSQK